MVFKQVYSLKLTIGIVYRLPNVLQMQYDLHANNAAYMNPSGDAHKLP